MSNGPLRTASPTLNGWNAEYIEQLHQQWRQDPSAVDPQWRNFFEGFELGMGRALAGSGASAGEERALAGVAASPRLVDIAHSRQGRVDSLIFHYRAIGHLAATIDPLGSVRPFPEQLTLESFELDDATLDERFDPGILPLDNPAPLREIIALLEDTYCRNIGVEYMHIQDRERRRWLQRRMETTRNRPAMEPAARLHLLRQLAHAGIFEEFLQTRFQGKKRFGLEGGESLIPLLDTFIELAPQNGIEEYAMGMAHRGRLNVLVNILRKTYAQVFTEFEEAWSEDFIAGGGDVKYHQGYSGARVTSGGHAVHLTLAANPSHLEYINAVVLGRTRAKQRQRHDAAREKVVPVVLHGDAAFPGQGIVAECFNMMRLDGYTVGGTLHVVINNQVGFTTNPRDLFSGRYCTDLAKMADAPIFHVNGDDPEACVWVARLALEYRQAFKNDVVIDMWCYRKHGHNETDEPSFTQPGLYAKIRQHVPVLKHYSARLVSEGIATEPQVKHLCDQVGAAMDEAQAHAKSSPVDPTIDPFQGRWAGLSPVYSPDPVHTAATVERLQAVAKVLSSVPETVTPHPTVARVLKARGDAFDREPVTIDWGLAELLAYGTLLLENHPVRLTGQDVERGTFSHRHAVVVDQKSDRPWVALQHLAPSIEPHQASFSIHNSPLTESACVGFEYGYSLTDPRKLILWEAQFGDFANGAQVFFDQFLASAQVKWQRYSGLVLLLPHGYEGQGPEHSSARLERFLQLGAGNNMQVCYPTTAAQLFHLLRRQVKVDFRRPLVVMTPKSMLRSTASMSPLAEFTDGHFQPVLDDPELTAVERVGGASRVILCSGKFGHELMERRRTIGREDLAVIRIEQLYPFPEEALRNVLARYPRATDLLWAQEEPRNMGAWRFIDATLRERMELEISGITRPANASPAAGSSKMHATEQERLLTEAVGAIGHAAEHVPGATQKAGA
jgi:2-oxoglutarate dehydrogenase E1 component